MYTLALDTSNVTLSVAIYNDKYESEIKLEGQLQHSLTLLPTIQNLFQNNDITIDDIDKIVVSNGPGSYTGLRIGVTTAKTLAYAKNIPLYSCSSLDLLQASLVHEKGYILSFFNARRNNVYAAIYKDGKKIMPDTHLPFMQLLEKIKDKEQVTFISPDIDEFIEQIEQSNVDIANLIVETPSASKVKYIIKEKVDCHTHIPTYIKKAQAEEEWEDNNDIIQTTLVEMSSL